SEGWWQPFPYKEAPDDRHRIKTVAPKHALVGTECHPDRYEPELMLEWCAEVPESELAKTRPRRFRKGDRVASTLHGPGDIMTKGHAAGTVVAVRDGKVRVRWDDDEDPVSPIAYHPDTGLEVDQAFAGMHAKIALLPQEHPPPRKRRGKSPARKRRAR
ncbi:MAG TPA: hypothetical protein VJ694_01705, partial [Patescibacteria group bacterium]|nr:hypothetical protein [Patescibacteria group bacterium]